MQFSTTHLCCYQFNLCGTSRYGSLIYLLYWDKSDSFFPSDEESPPPSSRKKKKKGGALSRLKERQANQNGSQTSLTSQEVLGVHADSAGDATGLTTSNIAEVLNEDEEVVSAAPQPTKITATYTFPDEDKLTGKTLTDSGNSFKISNGAGKITTGTESGQVNGAKGKQSLLGDDITNHSGRL